MFSEIGNYTSSWVVDFLHSWPHISFSFTILKSYSFGFDNSAYLESLAMVALMGIVWLLITMISFFIYFCCLKGKRKPDEKYNANGCYCSVCVLAVFLLLTLGAIAVTLFGNMQSTDGIAVAAASVQIGNKTFVTLADQVFNLQLMSGKIKSSIEDIRVWAPDDTDILSMEEMVSKAVEATDTFSIQLQGVEDRLAWSIEVLVITDYYRNIFTYCLVGLQCLVCFLGMFGLCCRSKCTLIVTIVIGMICITATYFYLSVNLMVSVGVSDFCVAPYNFLYNQTVEKNYMSVESADYFLKCEDSSFTGDLEEGRELLQHTLESGRKFVAKRNLTDDQQYHVTEMEADMNSFIDELDLINQSINCEVTKRALDDFVPSICVTTIVGFFVMAASMLGTGICMTFALCAAAKTGKRYGKDLYDSDSDIDLAFHDPFLPQPTRIRNGNTNRSVNITHTNNPIYATTASSNSNYGVASNTLSFFRHGSDEDVSLIETPPPYSPPHPTSRFSN